MIEVTDENFQEEVLDSTTPVVVDFWAVWCGPCKSMAPVFEEASQEYNTKAKFVKVNIDENAQNIAQRFNIRAVPTVVIVKNGVPEETLIGMHSRAKLGAWLMSNL